MGIIKTDDLIETFENKGFYYSKDLLFNYYISLITKPFVILTGISGSGKSKIAEVFAEIVGNDSNKSYELIPVKPNWRDNKGLFGYHNLIDNSYYITPMIQLFIRALKNPGSPYFLILDEMNIAKTEHYFADYLSLIESRRVEKTTIDNTLSALKAVFSYPAGTTLSEAIILAAIDINKSGQELEIEKYRNNRFSQLWKDTVFTGDPNNWTPQFRTELNQGNGRLAHRVFEGGNGKYKLKNKAYMNSSDRAIVERLEKTYVETINSGKTIVQDNAVLHNNSVCLGIDGRGCGCTNCTYKKADKYKCDKLYDEAMETYLVPPEMPIPLNLFTVGTVNIDETTYMFSPKVLDRSNVIEFNEVDFTGIYNISPSNQAKLNSVVNAVIDEAFYFDAGTDMPAVEITILDKENVNRFITTAGSYFDDLISIFMILKKHNLHFGYRVMNEVSLYMCNVFEHTSYNEREKRGLDNQILQKVLPKLYGSYDKIWKPLTEILGVLLNNAIDIKAEDADDLIDTLKNATAGKITALELDGTTADAEFKYPKSAMKVINMLADLNEAGFATFIK